MLINMPFVQFTNYVYDYRRIYGRV